MDTFPIFWWIHFLFFKKNAINTFPIFKKIVVDTFPIFGGYLSYLSKNCDGYITYFSHSIVKSWIPALLGSIKKLLHFVLDFNIFRTRDVVLGFKKYFSLNLFSSSDLKEWWRNTKWRVWKRWREACSALGLVFLLARFCKSLLCSMFNEQTCTRFTRLVGWLSPCPK